MKTSLSEIASEQEAHGNVMHLFSVVNNVPQPVDLMLDFEKLCDPATTRWDAARNRCVALSGGATSSSEHCAPGTVPVATVCRPQNSGTTSNAEESALIAASIHSATNTSSTPMSSPPSNLSPMPTPAPTPIDHAIRKVIDTVRKTSGVSGLSFDASNIEKAINHIVSNSK